MKNKVQHDIGCQNCSWYNINFRGLISYNGAIELIGDEVWDDVVGDDVGVRVTGGVIKTVAVSTRCRSI